MDRAALGAIRLSPGCAVAEPRLRRRVQDFARVLECRFPTVQDHHTPRWQKTMLRELARWRWATRVYSRPLELTLARSASRFGNRRSRACERPPIRGAVMVGPVEIARRARGRVTGRIESLPILALSVHSACNCRCVMCDIWKANSEKREISARRFDRHIEAIRALRVQRVMLTGGEPLLHRNLWAFCERVAGATYPHHAGDNGTTDRAARRRHGVVDGYRSDLARWSA